MATVLPFPPRLRAVPAPAPRSAPVSDADALAAELLLDLEELTPLQRLRVVEAAMARCAAELALDQRRPAGDARLTVLARMSATAERAAELAQRHATPAWPGPDSAA